MAGPPIKRAQQSLPVLANIGALPEATYERLVTELQQRVQAGGDIGGVKDAVGAAVRDEVVQVGPAVVEVVEAWVHSHLRDRTKALVGESVEHEILDQFKDLQNTLIPALLRDLETALRDNLGSLPIPSLETLSSELDSQTVRLLEAQRELAELELKHRRIIDQMRTRLATARRQRDTLVEETDAVHGELCDFRTEVDEMAANRRQRFRSSREGLDAAMDRVDVLKAEIEGEESDLQETKEVACAAAGAAASRLEEAADLCSLKADALSAQAAAAEGTVEGVATRVQAATTAAHASANTLEASASSASTKADEVDREVEEAKQVAQTKIDSLKVKGTVAGEIAASLIVRIDAATAKIQTATNRLEDTAAEASTKADAADWEVEAAEQATQTHIDSLKAKGAAAREIAASLTTRIDAATTTTKTATTRLEDIATTATTKADAAEKQVREVEQAAQTHIDLLKVTSTAAGETLDALTVRIDTATEATETATTRLEDTATEASAKADAADWEVDEADQATQTHIDSLKAKSTAAGETLDALTVRIDTATKTMETATNRLENTAITATTKADAAEKQVDEADRATQTDIDLLKAKSTAAGEIAASLTIRIDAAAAKIQTATNRLEDAATTATTQADSAEEQVREADQAAQTHIDLLKAKSMAAAETVASLTARIDVATTTTETATMRLEDTATAASRAAVVMPGAVRGAQQAAEAEITRITAAGELAAAVAAAIIKDMDCEDDEASRHLDLVAGARRQAARRAEMLTTEFNVWHNHFEEAVDLHADLASAAVQHATSGSAKLEAAVIDCRDKTAAVDTVGDTATTREIELRMEAGNSSATVTSKIAQMKKVGDEADATRASLVKDFENAKAATIKAIEAANGSAEEEVQALERELHEAAAQTASSIEAKRSALEVGAEGVFAGAQVAVDEVGVLGSKAASELAELTPRFKQSKEQIDASLAHLDSFGLEVAAARIEKRLTFAEAQATLSSSLQQHGSGTDVPHHAQQYDRRSFAKASLPNADALAADVDAQSDSCSEPHARDDALEGAEFYVTGFDYDEDEGAERGHDHMEGLLSTDDEGYADRSIEGNEDSEEDEEEEGSEEEDRVEMVGFKDQIVGMDSDDAQGDYDEEDGGGHGTLLRKRAISVGESEQGSHRQKIPRLNDTGGVPESALSDVIDNTTEGGVTPDVTPDAAGPVPSDVTVSASGCPHNEQLPAGTASTDVEQVEPEFVHQAAWPTFAQYGGSPQALTALATKLRPLQYLPKSRRGDVAGDHLAFFQDLDSHWTELMALVSGEAGRNGEEGCPAATILAVSVLLAASHTHRGATSLRAVYDSGRTWFMTWNAGTRPSLDTLEALADHLSCIGNTEEGN